MIYKINDVYLYYQFWRHKKHSFVWQTQIKFWQ